MGDEISESFKYASDHPYNCRCQKCLDWWVDIGPDGGEPDSFGPFTTEEVMKRAEERGVRFINGWAE